MDFRPDSDKLFSDFYFQMITGDCTGKISKRVRLDAGRPTRRLLQ